MKFIFKLLISSLGSKSFNFFYYKYLHIKFFKYPPSINWDKPKRFNQKIIWLKRNYRVKDAYIYVDKLIVKKYVQKKITGEIVIPTLGSWEDPNQINFDNLKKPFILKSNHGSGMNMIFKKKDIINKQATRKLLKKWLKTDYGYISGEYQYKNIQRKILAEPFLVELNGKGLKDYKFFCFNGKPKFIQVDFDRYSDHKRNFYNLSWQRLDFTYLFPSCEIDEKVPSQLNKMIEISEKLSKDFKFIRVDLYQFMDKVYFGELTFHPGGGFEPISPDSWDLKLGEYLSL